MRTFSAGPLRVHAAGGTDHDGGGEGPAVVLCHGFGAAGDDLVALHREIDAGPGVRWYFPEAPRALGGGYGPAARAWWPLDLLRLERQYRTGDLRPLLDDVPDGLDEARDALAACVDALEAEHGVQREALLLGGFSQGSMVTTELVLRGGAPCAGLVVLSGSLIGQARWRAAAATTAPGLEVFQSHGRVDPVLPFAAGDALRALLEGAGARVTFVPFQGGHGIGREVVEGLGAFARARFATA